MLDGLLRTLRERAGLTTTQVHQQLGVSRATAYNWEHPGSRPDPEHLGKLLDLYGATDAERLEAWRLRALPRNAADEQASADATNSDQGGE